MKNASAIGEYDFNDRSIIVKKGALVENKTSNSFFGSTYFNLRNNLIDKQIIDENFILVEDYHFQSLSSAAAVIGGRPASGPLEWRDENGIQVKDLIDSDQQDVSLITDNEKYEHLVDFMEDIEVLDELQNITDFNLFETLSLIKTEIRHSNVIAWLLNPNETHEIGDFFAKSFIRNVYKNNKRIFSNYKLKSEDVYLWDYDEIEVLREYENIDILIIDKEHSLVVVIENKIDSKQFNNQLDRYESKIKKLYPNFKHLMFVYLTVDGTEPENAPEWATLSYEIILEILDSLEFTKISKKVISFIEDYKAIIRRHLLTDTNLEEICRKIYSKHKRALDLIYEYKPDIVSEINAKLKSIINENEDYKENHSIKSIIRFSTKILDRVNDIYRDVSSGWVKDNSIILHAIKIYDKSVNIITAVGPSDDDSRDKIIKVFVDNNLIKKIPSSSKFTKIKSSKIFDYTEEDSMEDIIQKIEDNFEERVFKHVQVIDSLIKLL